MSQKIEKCEIKIIIVVIIERNMSFYFAGNDNFYKFAAKYRALL